RRAVRTDLRVGMPLVVDHLVLVRDRAVAFAILAHQILHAAVGAGRDLPLELQIEVVERVDRDDVAAALPALRRRDVFQPTVLHDPAVLWKRGLLEAAPAVRRLAVEEEPVARGLAGERGARKNDRDETEELGAHRSSLFTPM